MEPTQRRPEEQQSIRTTIVGARPPGCGKAIGPVPRGIDIALMKASVDRDFKAALLDKRAVVMDELGLRLEPAERAILDSIPSEQLEAAIARTKVKPEHRAAFARKEFNIVEVALILGLIGIVTVSSMTTLGHEAKPTPVSNEVSNRIKEEDKEQENQLAPQQEHEGDGAASMRDREQRPPDVMTKGMRADHPTRGDSKEEPR